MHPRRFTHTRALVRDRASQFTGDFDEICRTEGLKILKTLCRPESRSWLLRRRFGIRG